LLRKSLSLGAKVSIIPRPHKLFGQKMAPEQQGHHMVLYNPKRNYQAFVLVLYRRWVQAAAFRNTYK